MASIFGRLKESRCFHALGDAEIGNFDVAVVVYENVRTFNVPVNDISVMEVRQALENLTDEVADKRLAKLTVRIKHSCN